MRKEDAERTARFLRKWEERLRLQHYTIDYQFHQYAQELPSEVAEGQCLAGRACTWPEVERAQIDVLADGQDAPATFYGRHELCHVLLAPLGHVLMMLEDQVAPPVFAVVRQAFEEAEERVVRRLDDVFEEFEPLLSDDEEQSP